MLETNLNLKDRRVKRAGLSLAAVLMRHFS